jgi:hypothetical protein
LEIVNKVIYLRNSVVALCAFRVLGLKAAPPAQMPFVLSLDPAINTYVAA